MKFYLSSYKFGNSVDTLRTFAVTNNRIGYINNARDFVGRNAFLADQHQKDEMNYLTSLGFKTESLNLLDYFKNENGLLLRLEQLDGLWVSGGNVFVLRQAMRLSGFDLIFEQLYKRKNFLYAGYSAGICILSKSLHPFAIVDDPYNFPYKEINQPIFKGLGHIEHIILPHFKSDHPESDAIDKAVQNCIDNNWTYKTLSDGDVIILQ